jgi:hypothetical protein
MLRLREAHMRGDWAPLLSRLGWKRNDCGNWSDGDNQLIVEPGRTLTAKPPIIVLAEPGMDADDRATRGAALISPNGIEVRIVAGGVSQATGHRPGRYCMNHVALHVPNLLAEREWFETLLHTRSVLARDSIDDPIAGRCSDAHLARSSDFYITLRGPFTPAEVNHIGWMAANREDVVTAAKVLTAIGWPIVLGPVTVDQSFLVHFVGPDGHIHDFFCPMESLGLGNPI